MAKTIRTYIGDAASTLYPVDFDLGYISRSHVYVYLDTEDTSNQLDYTWINDAQIQLTAPVATGVTFHIRRIVPRNVLVHDYEDGAIMHEENLDDSNLQPLMILEENDDSRDVLEGTDIKRAIRISDTDPTTDTNLILDTPANRAHKVLSFGANGEVLTVDSGVTFNTLADAAAADLRLYANFHTLGGLVSGDNMGATFAATGGVSVPQAGTVEIGSATFYDITGKEFKYVGDTVRLETLGLVYTETAADVRSRIFDLRQNGYKVDVSPRYTGIDIDRRADTIDTDWEISIHRGWVNVNVENTSQSFTNAQAVVGKGIKTSWELDVQITSDGIPVVFHDDTVDADTDGTGEIKNLTFAQVRALKFNRAEATMFDTYTRIPTFDRIVRLAAREGVKIMPEVKQYRTIADVELMTAVIQKYGMSENCIWTSFQVSDLQEVRKYETQSQIGWAATGDLTQFPLLKAIEGNKPAMIFRSDNAMYSDPTLVDLDLSWGFITMAFTINLAREIQNLADIKVRRAFSDENVG